MIPCAVKRVTTKLKNLINISYHSGPKFKVSAEDIVSIIIRSPEAITEESTH